MNFFLLIFLVEIISILPPSTDSHPNKINYLMTTAYFPNSLATLLVKAFTAPFVRLYMDPSLAPLMPILLKLIMLPGSLASINSLTTAFVT